MAGHVGLTISSDADAGKIVRAVVESFASTAGAQPSAIQPLSEAVCGVLAFVSDAVYPETLGELQLGLELEKWSVRVQVRDWGRPLPAAGDGVGAIPAPLADAARGAADLRIVNLGREGKLTSFSWPLELPEASPTSAHARHAAAATGETATETPVHTQDEVEVRDATPDDAEGISDLLYDHYALGYVHSDFYRPRWVADQLRTGTARSTVALARNEVIGHHALLLAGGEAWALSGVAVVHPAYRGLGVFGRLMKRTIAKATDIGLEAVCGEAVTIHPYSQRAEHAFGYRETALTLGSQPPIGADGDRHAQLLSYLMLSPTPRAVALPAVYEGAVRAAYANAGLGTTGSSPAAGTSMSWSQNDERQTARVTIAGWDGDSETRFAHGLREMLAGHVDVVYADVDLTVTEDVDTVVELLNERGFFYAGVRPCAVSGHDTLCLQRLNSRNLELERIVCDSEYAQGLLEYVRDDRERVEQIAR